jgi:hypothetical protein
VHFRKEQLKKLRQMIEQNKDRIAEAVHKDLRRSVEVTMQMEVGPGQNCPKDQSIPAYILFRLSVP